MFRRHLLFAACVSIAGLSMPLYAQQDNAGANRMDPPATQPGMTGGMNGMDRSQDRQTLAPDYKDITKTIATATEAAFDKSGFDNLIKRFVDADRDRLKKNDLTSADWDKLNGRIAEIQKDWKAKYNEDFKIKHPDDVFGSTYTIIQGRIGDAQTASGRIPGNTGTTGDVNNPNNPNGNAGNADKSAPDTTPGPQSDRVAGGDVNREPGRRVAKVTIPAGNDLPELYIPMIREFPDSWKIDVPDTVTARKLYDNLLTHLTTFDEHKELWPADVNDAYRLAAHHVMIAVMDVGQSSGDMNGNNNTMPGGTGTSGTGTGTGR